MIVKVYKKAETSYLALFLRKLVKSCWQKIPRKRPSWSIISEKLSIALSLAEKKVREDTKIPE